MYVCTAARTHLFHEALLMDKAVHVDDPHDKTTEAARRVLCNALRIVHHRDRWRFLGMKDRDVVFVQRRFVVEFYQLQQQLCHDWHQPLLPVGVELHLPRKIRQRHVCHGIV
jgi:hypothetical protein